ncbi:uncharacterized protein TNCV_5032971 [Trichonephila clavipes]|nr:uncharacterized protein TNCV_5032971 [Trichonephila clavipes]
MWSMVAQRLTQITHLAATPDQLWQRMEAAWSAVPQEHIQSLFESMPKRILGPKCNDGESFCRTCQNSCPEKEVSTCSEKAETFYSYTKNCISLDDDSFCETTLYTGELTVMKSITIDVEQPGYNYVPLKEEDYTEVTFF